MWRVWMHPMELEFLAYTNNNLCCSLFPAQNHIINTYGPINYGLLEISNGQVCNEPYFFTNVHSLENWSNYTNTKNSICAKYKIKFLV